MAKVKKMELPTVDEMPEVAVDEATAHQPDPPSADEVQHQVKWKTIKVPMLEGHELPLFLRKPRLDMRQISQKQQNAIYKLGNALLAIGEVTSNGSLPKYRGRVIGWLLEQLAE